MCCTDREQSRASVLRMTFRSKQVRDPESFYQKSRVMKLTDCTVLGAPFEYFAHEQWRVAARVNISE
jgi:hypothetical protein